MTQLSERKGLLRKECTPLCCGQQNRHKHLSAALECAWGACVSLWWIMQICPCVQGILRCSEGVCPPPWAEVIHCCPPAVAPCPLLRCLVGYGSDSVPHCCASCRSRASFQAPCAPGWTGPPAKRAALSMHQRGREDLGWWHSKEKNSTFVITEHKKKEEEKKKEKILRSCTKSART